MTIIQTFGNPGTTAPCCAPAAVLAGWGFRLGSGEPLVRVERPRAAGVSYGMGMPTHVCQQLGRPVAGDAVAFDRLAIKFPRVPSPGGKWSP